MSGGTPGRCIFFPFNMIINTIRMPRKRSKSKHSHRAKSARRSHRSVRRSRRLRSARRCRDASYRSSNRAICTRDDHLVFRAPHPPKQFLKFWRIGFARSFLGNVEHFDCAFDMNQDTIAECRNELAFYEWLYRRQHHEPADYLTRHLPYVYEISRHSEKLPQSPNIRLFEDRLRTGDFVFPDPQYAYVLMEDLEGVTLGELYSQSKTIKELATHARECFKQVYQTLKLLHMHNWYHYDLHEKNYIFYNARWYLIDFGLIYTPGDSEYPTTFPWESWQHLAKYKFAEYLEDRDLCTPEEVDDLRKETGVLWNLLVPPEYEEWEDWVDWSAELVDRSEKRQRTMP